MSVVPKHFIGRDVQLRMMEKLFNSHERWSSPFIISGEPGIGKTAFLAGFCELLGRRLNPLWLPIRHPGMGRTLDELREVVHRERESRSDRGRRALIVDGADTFTDEEMEELFRAGRNFKLIQQVFITTRRQPKIAQSPVVQLSGLLPRDSVILFRTLAEADVPTAWLDQIAAFSKGNPATIELLAGVLRTGGLDGLGKAISGQQFDLAVSLPESKILTVARPQIILANDNLFEQLRKEPQGIYLLPPRKFEETIAELLSGMGMQVELTPQSHDDGRDILAYLDTPVGKFLTLVECKRYREDNKVGIELVKQLWATLVDSHANRAMMVTTSSFTKGAQDFQKKYQWQMELKDFSHVADWIGKHNTGG